MTGAIEIRAERPQDVDSIRDLVRTAFGRGFEALIVDRLRASADFLPGLSLVAAQNDSIIGHVMITAQSIVADDGAATPSTILAPLAVAPVYHGKGIGQALTRAALNATRSAGHGSVILLGLPTYYPRFGFRPASTGGIRCMTSVPDDVFTAIELVPGALSDARGTVTLSPAFDEL